MDRVGTNLILYSTQPCRFTGYFPLSNNSLQIQRRYTNIGPIYIMQYYGPHLNKYSIIRIILTCEIKFLIFVIGLENIGLENIVERKNTDLYTGGLYSLL